MFRHAKTEGCHPITSVRLLIFTLISQGGPRAQKKGESVPQIVGDFRLDKVFSLSMALPDGPSHPN